MSRVYDAIRRATEERKEGRAGALDMPPAVEFVDESFPAEAAALAGAATSARPGPVLSAVASGAAPVTLPPAVSAAVDAPAISAVATVEEASTVVTPAEPITETFSRVAAQYEGKTVLEAEVSPQSREQYRRLAASLHHAQAIHGIKVIMVTSALVGEGKTLTSSNLALTLSQSYQKQVLLMDADLRRPSLQAVFGIHSGPGLTEGLTSSRDRGVPVHQVTPRLGILQAGRPTSDPIAALTSQRMKQLIDEARTAFDWIILDTPPVALLTDASLVSAMTDGAIIVVKAGSTPYELVERAVAAIGREKTLGVVLNHAELAVQGTGYYGNYYYGGAAK